ncbi:hypothetical protein [Granulicella tundricola]|nr:hypothetical protein [Granulicella tundricola]
MEELVFVITPDEEDGGFCAAAVGVPIFTQGDDWLDLCAMVLDATKCYYYDSEPPATVRLMLREQVLKVA